MIEEWKDIPGYEGLYEASTLGRIRTNANKVTTNSKGISRHWKQRILKTKRRKHGCRRSDERVTLYKDGIPNDWLVSRLVALTWCDGYAPGMTVNHKDCNPLNNHVDNLEWITLGDNIRHGIANGMFVRCQRPISIIIDGVETQFPSMAAASMYLGKHKRYVADKIRSQKGRSELGFKDLRT